MMQRHLAHIIAIHFCAVTCTAQTNDSTGVLMESVQVTAQRFTSHFRTRADGARQIDLGLMHSLPQILGNADPLHHLQLLPGVQTCSEYDAGLHIQGFDNAHNEVSISGVPLYGVTHLLGFFSVFNASHFSSMIFSPTASTVSPTNKLGGFLQMESTTNIPPRTTGELSVGPISSQGTLKLPLSPSMGIVASARGAYLNLLYGRWLKADDATLRYSFGDVNLTWFFKPSKNNLFWLDAYAGEDRGGYDFERLHGHVDAQWGNHLVALHWIHRHDEWESHHTAYTTAYYNRLHIRETEMHLQIPSSITDWGYQGTLITPHRWTFHARGIYHRIQPQAPQLTGTWHKEYEETPLQHGTEISVQAKRKWDLTEHIAFEPSFMATLWTAQHQKSRLLPTPAATITYRHHSNATTGFHYAWQHQPLFQCGFTSSGMPTEFWMAADNDYEPQEAHHFTLTHEHTFANGQWSLSANAYYALLRNQLEYEGTVLDFVTTTYNPSHHLLYGKGRNYGLNLMLHKRTGRLTGWLSYAVGRSLRTFNLRDKGERTYPSNHERIHEFNAMATYHVGRWDLGLTGVFSTGTPFTAPLQFYLVSGNIISQYGEHNANRLRPYRRVDVSVGFRLKDTSRYESGINVSAYNVLCFRNDITYYLTFHSGKFAYRPTRFILSLMPSVSYYIRFK